MLRVYYYISDPLNIDVTLIQYMKYLSENVLVMWAYHYKSKFHKSFKNSRNKGFLFILTPASVSEYDIDKQALTFSKYTKF